MEQPVLLEKMKKDNIKFVKLQFSDLFGTLKSVTIPVEKVEESLSKGTWFDGSSIEGFTRIFESDMYLKPDPSTYAVLPWRPQTDAVCRLICDVYTPDGEPFAGDPRFILKTVLAEAKGMGFNYNVGPELEFFLLKTDENGRPLVEPHDHAGYFDSDP